MVTFDVKDALICVVLVALLILIIYCIMLIRKLLKTVDETNKVVEDASVVSGIAADKATEIDGIVTDLSGAVSNITSEVNHNQGIIKTATNMGKAAASAVSYFRSDEGKEKRRKRKCSK